MTDFLSRLAVTATPVAVLLGWWVWRNRRWHAAWRAEAEAEAAAWRAESDRKTEAYRTEEERRQVEWRAAAERREADVQLLLARIDAGEDVPDEEPADAPTGP